VVWFRLK